MSGWEIGWIILCSTCSLFVLACVIFTIGAWLSGGTLEG